MDTRVTRVDRAAATQFKDGIVKGRTCRVGVQMYDGRRELRPPAELFRDETMRSLASAPLLLGHGGAEVGRATSANVSSDRAYVEQSFAVPVEHRDAVENADPFFSGEFTCRLDPPDAALADAFGEHDAVQSDITYTAMAIVSSPRCGSSCARIDCADCGGSCATKQGETMGTKKATEAAAASATVKIDETEFQVPAPVAAHLERVQAELDVLRSSAQQTVVDEAAIKTRADAATSERLAVIDRVRDHVSRHIELAKMDAVEIMRIGIAKLRPDLASKLDGKGREYVEVVFDAVVPKPIPAITRARASVIAPDIDPHGDDLDREVDLSPKEKMDAAYDALYFKNRPVVVEEQPVKAPRVRVTADENLSPRERMLAMYDAAYYFKNGKGAK